MTVLDRRAFLVLGSVTLLSGCAATMGPLVETGSTGPDALTPERITAIINSVRKANGQKAWAYNAQLAEAARSQANLMAKKDQLSHDLGVTLRERVNAAGYRGAVGENLAGGQRTLEQAIEGWLGSDGHKRTLLSPKFTEFGLAVARTTHKSRYGVYWALIAGGSYEAWIN